MQKFKYIIIGGGMTGSAALQSIRENDPDGSLALFSDEKYIPYDRPPLSKGLWSGKETSEIFRSLPEEAIDLYLETEITKINPEEQKITDENGQDYHYQKLLLATGGHPIQLPDAPQGVITYRTLDDYKTLQAQLKPESKLCVIGGGFIGSEIAAALNKNGHHVTMIFPEIGISGLRFPNDLALFLNDYYRGKGVKVFNGCLVQSIAKTDGNFKVTYKNIDDETITDALFDRVIVGIGIKPNLDLAANANLMWVMASSSMNTSKPAIQISLLLVMWHFLRIFQ